MKSIQASFRGHMQRTTMTRTRVCAKRIFRPSGLLRNRNSINDSSCIPSPPTAKTQPICRSFSMYCVEYVAIDDLEEDAHAIRNPVGLTLLTSAATNGAESEHSGSCDTPRGSPTSSQRKDHTGLCGRDGTNPSARLYPRIPGYRLPSSSLMLVSTDHLLRTKDDGGNSPRYCR